MTLWLGLLACGAPDASPVPGEAAAPDPATEARNDDPSWGKGCNDRNEDACVLWGRKAHDAGEDFEAFLRPSCERGHGPGCFWLGELLALGGTDASETTPLFQRACDFGDGNGCRRVAETLAEDAPERLAILKKGCALKCVKCCQMGGLPLPTW